MSLVQSQFAKCFENVDCNIGRCHYQSPIFLEVRHEISNNNVVCATSKASDQPAHTRSLIKAFATRLDIL